MKQKKWKSIVAVLLSLTMLFAMASCMSQAEPEPVAPSEAPAPDPTPAAPEATPAPAEAEPANEPEVVAEPEPEPAPAEAADYVADTSAATELNMTVFYQSNIYMTYTADGANNRPQSEYAAANGKTYREGDFKPVWEEIQNRLNFKINDVTPTSAANIREAFTFNQAQGFAGVDVTVGNPVDVIQEATINGTFLPLDEYMQYMPNLNSFLEENSIIKKAITSGDGHMYYAPYFDGYDDIERMLMVRTDWVEKLLDGDAAYDTDRVIESHYTPYMPETLTTDIQAVTSDGSAVQTVTKSYTKNVITAQNELASMDGASLVQVLKDHIDATYGGAFAKRSDLFCGQDAAYDADELVALMRCVLANTTLLTGQSEMDAVPFFPRWYQMGRVQDLLSLAQIWGVRGLDVRQGHMYVNNDGELVDGRMEADQIASLEKLNQLYKEGLLLKDFDKAEATEGLTGADHRERLLRANLGFMTYDYNQTTTVLNSLDSEIDGFTFTPILPPVANWDGDGKYYQFTESWRSVKGDSGWSILTTLKDDEVKLMRALALFDYLYSPEGNTLMSYGPEAWVDGTVEYMGEQVPKLSDAALNELATLAGGNYTNYYRMWLGGTFPIGYVKQQGMEYQTVHEKGKIGLEYILRAVELGTMKHLVMSETDAEKPSQLTIPTTFATTADEELFMRDNCAELTLAFRNGNNDTDRIMFVDYVLYGFGGTTPTGETLLDQAGLQSYLASDLNCEGFITVMREAYNRMMQ